MTTQVQENPLRPLKLLAFMFVPALMFVTAFAVFNLIETETARGWLLILCIIQLIPFVMFLMGGRVDYMMLIMGQTFIGFTAARYQRLMFEAVNLDRWEIEGLKERVICTVISLVVFQAARLLFFRKEETFQAPDVSPGSLTYFAFWPLVLIFISPYMPPSTYSLLDASRTFAILIVFSATCRERPSCLIFLRLSVCLIMFYTFVVSGSLGAMVQLGMFILALGFVQKNSRMILVLIPVGVLILLLQAIKGQFRVVALNMSSNADRMVVLSDLVSNEVANGQDSLADPNGNLTSSDDDDDENSALDQTLWRSYSRLEDDSLERVLAMTPSQVPFWQGESYSSLLFIYVPRLFWPDKPVRDFWNKFGRLYQVLLPTDFATSISVNYLAEGYMNFGFLGLYGVATIFGLLAALNEKLALVLLEKPSALIYAFLLVPLLSYQSDLGSIINTQAVSIVGLVFVRRWLNRRTLPPEPA